jgi:hypothetical protein
LSNGRWISPENLVPNRVRARTTVVVHAIAVLAGIAALGGNPRTARAQEALSAAVRRDVVDTVASQIERIYVDADTGRMIAARLRARLSEGAYDAAPEPARFAQMLTTDLRSVNHDLHLSVSYSPAGRGGGPGRGSAPAFLSRSQHFALGRADVLPGNIGYLEINGFSIDREARDAIVGALQYLQTTDAMILDLRRNRGGDGNLVNFLISHFTGPDTLASVTVKVRGAQRPFTRYTLASVPGPRRPDVPLYVLTSRATGSAGEDCAFVLQNLKRATIIGDRTAGAGHNVTSVPSGHGFTTGISFSRVSDPRTGREWEQVGVQPDVKVDVATAVDVAQSLALETISRSADAATRAALDPILATVNARLHPHAVPAATLASYAGTYEGNRRISVDGDRLMYELPIGAPREPVLALSDSEFLASSQARLIFERNEHGAMRLRVRSPDGSALTYERISAGQAPQ